MSDDTDPADGYDRPRATEALKDSSLEVDDVADADRQRAIKPGGRARARRRVTRQPTRPQPREKQ